jgi:hypothetical protein
MRYRRVVVADPRLGNFARVNLVQVSFGTGELGHRCKLPLCGALDNVQDT